MSAATSLRLASRASRRFFVRTAPRTATIRPLSADATAAKLSSPKLQELYGDITKLKEEEVNVLGALLLQMLGRKIFPGEFGRGLEGLVLAAPVVEEEEEKVEQTVFAIKLMGTSCSDSGPSVGILVTTFLI